MYRQIDELRFTDLADLIAGEVVALCWRGFYPTEQCEYALARIENHDKEDVYEVTRDLGPIKKIGKAIFDYAGQPEAIDEYYENVAKTNELLLHFFEGAPPLNIFFEQVDAVWPNGACVESLHGQDMYYGLIRKFPRGSFALPHQDMTAWDIPSSINAKKIEKQFGANIYLKAPNIGGELTVFNYGFRNYDAYEGAKIPGTYGIDISQIKPMPTRVMIAPNQGDLIIFNSQYLHSVSENMSDDMRVTTSCFIDYSGNDESLKFFS